ncbi:hypothetical protein, partial [Streptomyces lasiicapitis]|uniref:hypothetical protein n=1 Tax=Streptomyces lasiicapitis TaxID=1923961 RepID=UPI00369284CF
LRALSAAHELTDERVGVTSALDEADVFEGPVSGPAVARGDSVRDGAVVGPTRTSESWPGASTALEGHGGSA